MTFNIVQGRERGLGKLTTAVNTRNQDNITILAQDKPNIEITLVQ